MRYENFSIFAKLTLTERSTVRILPANFKYRTYVPLKIPPLVRPLAHATARFTSNSAPKHVKPGFHTYPLFTPSSIFSVTPICGDALSRHQQTTLIFCTFTQFMRYSL